MFKITCYDEKGFPMTHLTQWDIDITLYVEGAQLGPSPQMPNVHWSNRYTADALVVETKDAGNGMLAVKVPNILLQKGTPAIGYMYIYGLDGAAGYSRSVYNIRLPVRPRQKPMDYMYTETEILTLQRVEKRLNDRIDAVDAKVEALNQELVSHTSNKANPHEVTKEQVGLGNVDNTSDMDKPISRATQAALDKKADLDDSGKVPASQLPSYVDDVLEFDSMGDFPALGETGKIYTDLSANLIYRWSGSTYVEISQSIALGETDATAYRGDRGKIAYDHALSAHVQTKADIGLGNVDNTSDMDKPVSTATQNAIHAAIAALVGGSSGGEGGSSTGDGSAGDNTGSLMDKINQKVDKIEGKGLSSNDFTDEEKAKLAGLEGYIHPDIPGWKHIPAGGSIGQKLLWAADGEAAWGELTKNDVGLDNVDNTSDVDKPVSAATQAAIDLLQQNIDAIGSGGGGGAGGIGGGTIVSDAAPDGNPTILWIDTANGGIAKYWNGSAWMTVKAVWG